MKRVLFTMPSYELGGITVSLFSLLSKIDPKELKVDVFASPVGPYSGKMPNCTELPQNIWLSYPYVGGNVFVKLFQTFVYGLRYAFSKIHIDLFPIIYRIGGKAMGTDKYDAVVCFSEGQASTVCYYPAKKHIQWIHCDYRRCGGANDRRGQIKAYKRIDKVICVSEFACDIFRQIYPEFADKTIAIHNIANTEHIIAKSKELIDDSRFDTSAFTIISCGRLDSVKQFSKIPTIAASISKLTDKPFRWYIIGGGDNQEEATIKKAIVEASVENQVIMLGPKSNPYPYMAKANLYVCTSSSESYPMAIKEAETLGIPVVSNNFPSAKEVVAEGKNGRICSMEQIASNVADIIDGILKLKSESGSDENNSIIEQVIGLF